MRAEHKVTAAPSLYRLMATYWERCDVLAQAMRQTDLAEHGSAERAAAARAQSKAGEALDEIALQICAFLPQTDEEARAKAQFVCALTEENGGTLDEPELAALLSSLPHLVLSAYARRERGL